MAVPTPRGSRDNWCVNGRSAVSPGCLAVRPWPGAGTGAVFFTVIEAGGTPAGASGQWLVPSGPEAALPAPGEPAPAWMRKASAPDGAGPGGSVELRLSRPGSMPCAAVLSYGGGRAVVYCEHGEIASLAAQAVGALASGAADGEPGSLLSVDVAPVGHGALPGALHPAARCTQGAQAVIAVCEDMISPRLAGALGLVLTVHLRRLRAAARL